MSTTVPPAPPPRLTLLNLPPHPERAEWEAQVCDLSKGLIEAGFEVLLPCPRRHKLRNGAAVVFPGPWPSRLRRSQLATLERLDNWGVPYLGSSPWLAFLLLERDSLRDRLQGAGVKVPAAVRWPVGHPAEHGSSCPVPLPAWIHPVMEHTLPHRLLAESTVSLYRGARRLALSSRQAVLLETDVPGLEVEVPILADPKPRALGVAARIPRATSSDPGFAPLPAGLALPRIEHAAVRAFQALDLRDFGRIDLRVDAAGQPWFARAEPWPDLSRQSSFFWLVEQRQMTYPQMLREIVEAGLRRLFGDPALAA